MATNSNLSYSRKQIKNIGKRLAGDIAWRDEDAGELHSMFRLANHWIASHMLPMARFRHELVTRIKSSKIDGITVGRLKSMRSIRRKLRVKPEGLHQLQDLGGCRSIVASIEQASSLVENQISTSRHRFIRHDNYVANPKIDGYRSHHLVYEFQGLDEEEVYSGRKIELQIRTRLQHSWATAVEAVGLFRNENLKGGDGDPSWLRFFQLMSAELAYCEQCPVFEGAPARDDRIAEIIELGDILNAVNILDGTRDAVRSTEINSSDPNFRPTHYLVTYDHDLRTVQAKPYARKFHDPLYLGVVELHADATPDENMTVVLVEADKVENLKDAFPNYFGDVSIFSENLKRITSGCAAKTYTMPPQQVAVASAETKADPRWLRPGRGRRWQ